MTVKKKSCKNIKKKTKQDTSLTPPDNEIVLKKPNEPQKLFCQYYIFGIKTGKKIKWRFNGTYCYGKAYDLKMTKKNILICAVGSSRLLRDEKVKAYMQELLKEAGLTNEVADTVLLDLMKHPSSWKARRDGLKEYNKVKGRITRKTEHSVADPLDKLLREIRDNK